MSSMFKVLGAVFLIIFLFLNYYVGFRCLQAIKAFYPSFKSIMFWPFYTILASAYILDRVFTPNNPGLKVVGSYWLAVFFYLLLLFVVIDLIGLLNSPFKVLPSSWVAWWQNRKIYSLALIITFGLILIGSWFAVNPYIAKYNVKIAKNMEEINHLKIVMISDLHIESLARTDYMEEAAHNISALNPDLIFIVGDIVEGALDTVSEKKLKSITSNLHAQYGIYAVLGNHEYYSGQADQIASQLEAHGIKVLRDTAAEILGGKIYLVGREDYRSGHFNSSSRKSLATILSEADRSKPLLLLDHQPQAVDEAKEAGIDLMLSGHTHGGQLFPAQLVTQSIFVIDRGHWSEGNFNLIVSTGLGLWGPPIRTNSRAEIVEINLSFAGS